MIHQGSGGFRGNTPDVEIQMREMMHLTDRLMHILAEHCGQEFEKVKRDSERDYFMSAEEAKAYGLIDEVFAGNTESLISMAQKAGGEMPTADEAAAADAAPTPEKSKK
jgi:ATP-dependent protease ClpP protease subunit